MSLLRKQMATHKENDCKYRLVECQICGDSIIFCEQRVSSILWIMYVNYGVVILLDVGTLPD